MKNHIYEYEKKNCSKYFWQHSGFPGMSWFEVSIDKSSVKKVKHLIAILIRKLQVIVYNRVILVCNWKKRDVNERETIQDDKLFHFEG